MGYNSKEMGGGNLRFIIDFIKNGLNFNKNIRQP